jgi:TetR/AcrR family transcriptional regulator, cholesterol catabolism regulator
VKGSDFLFGMKNMATRKLTREKRQEAPEQSLQDELRALKSERILQVAGKLFVERGFTCTTMEAIAERLKMTKPFIYQFFENKHAVLVAICRRELKESLSILSDPSTSSGSPDKRLVNFIRVATRKNIMNRDLWSLMASEEKQLPKQMLSEIHALEIQFHEHLTAIIEDGAKQDLFRIKHPQLASRAVMGMTQWVRRWYRPTDVPPDDVAEEFCRLALQMLGCTHPTFARDPV